MGVTMCWALARTNGAAGLAHGLFCSGWAVAAIWSNKKLRWREGERRAWAGAVSMGSWCQGRS